LNFGSPESPELVVSDLIHAAETGLIRPDEFRKNAVKFGWELSEPKSGSGEGQQPQRSPSIEKLSAGAGAVRYLVVDLGRKEAASK
jgi:hypothetical protein